jgi:hypothetical protein
VSPDLAASFALPGRAPLRTDTLILLLKAPEVWFIHPDLQTGFRQQETAKGQTGQLSHSIPQRPVKLIREQVRFQFCDPGPEEVPILFDSWHLEERSRGRGDFVLFECPLGYQVPIRNIAEAITGVEQRSNLHASNTHIHTVGIDWVIQEQSR